MKTQIKNKYKSIEIDGYKMNYIDEGEGDVILFSHGTPSSSFQFRELISELSKNYRCIAPDMMGFGYSDKPTNIDYTPKAHSIRLAKFIDKLGIKPKYIYGHDFGFPILMGAMLEDNNIECVEKIFISNTWLWDLRPINHFEKAGKMPLFIAKFLYINLNFSPKYLLPMAFYDKNKLTKELHNLYLKPFETKDSRVSLFTFFKELLASGDWYQSLFNSREKFAHIQKVLIWGMEDKLIPADIMLPTWKEKFNNLTVYEIENAGHFPEEEQSGKVIKIMESELGKYGRM